MQMARWFTLIVVLTGLEVWPSTNLRLIQHARGQEPLKADIVLKNGTVFDGSGEPGVAGDVAILGDKIVGVGKLTLGQVDRTIDCSGLYVVPGFIDLHTHSDEQVVQAKTRACVNYLLQGCTTSVTGNCGYGPIDVAKYYSEIDLAGAGTNVAHLLPQGGLRGHVVGPENRPATADELQKMRELAEKAMKDGAWGMTSGLIYVPSVHADTEELSEIAKVIGAHGGIYASHIRGEGAELLTSVAEAIKIGDVASCPVHISHFKSSGSEHWGMIRQAAAQIEAARAAGKKVTADQYPYTSSSTSLEATLFPTWARAGGSKGLLARFNDSEVAPRIKAALERSLQATHNGEDVVIARFVPKPDWVGKSVRQIAEEEKKSTSDLACEFVKLGEAAVVHACMCEDDVRFAMQLPWVATASDGRAYVPGPDRPHPRSYGTFARKIGHYAIAEKVISVEKSIHSSTGLPADILGFPDRGYLKTSYAADIAVIDPRDFIDTATYQNPHRYAKGVRYVFVNGVPAVHEGVPTGALAGKTLRRKHHTE